MYSRLLILLVYSGTNIPSPYSFCQLLRNIDQRMPLTHFSNGFPRNVSDCTSDITTKKEQTTDNLQSVPFSPQKNELGVVTQELKTKRCAKNQEICNLPCRNNRTMRFALYWDIMQRKVAIHYRRFETAYRSHL